MVCINPSMAILELDKTDKIKTGQILDLVFKTETQIRKSSWQIIGFNFLVKSTGLKTVVVSQAGEKAHRGNTFVS